MVDILKLIDCMRARTPLWNRQSPLYTARAMKKQLWTEVVALTGVTEDEVRRKWKCLNDIFRREYNKYTLRKKQDPDAEPPQWKYYYHMLFLESQIGMRFSGNTPKKTNSDLLVDMLKDDRDDHSLDSSLAFEDLSNLADVSIKMEVLDGNSLGYDDDDADAIVEAITVSPSYEHFKKECNPDSALAVNDNDEPPTKRAKKVVNDQQQRFNNTNLRQTDSNVNQDNFALSSGDVRNVPRMPKGDNNITPNVSTQHVDSTITQRLFSLEQRQFEDYKHMLRQQQRQHQQREQNEHHNNDDGDYHFALSLVPTMRRLPTQRKMLLRLKIQQLLCEEAELLMNAVNQVANDE